MAKFKVGDRARVIYVRSGEYGGWEAGIIVKIVSVHIGDPAHKVIGTRDYTVMLKNGTHAYPSEEQLEPILEVGSWDEIEESIGWNPTKTTEKKEANYSSSSPATA